VNTNLARLLLGTSALVSYGLPGAASAQTAAPGTTKAAPDADTTDIVVTGDRNNKFGTDVVQSGSFRSAKVLDVPMTVSVIPSAVLISQQAVDLIDAVRNTAGVSSSGVGPASYNNITIRGIAVDTRSSYKLNGTLNILSSTAFPLEDKDRVEVLKGASAIYYGFSPPSGIVNLVMKRATPELYLAERTFFDTNGGIGEHLDVGDTVGIFGYRVNLVAAHQDTGVKFGSGSRYVASGTFDVKPTEKLTISADVEWFKKNIVEPASFIIPNGVTAIPNVKLLNPSTNIGGLTWDNNNTEELNYLGKAVYQFNKDWDVSGYYGRSHLTRYRYNPGFVPGTPTTAAGAINPGGTATLAQYYAAINPSNAAYGTGSIRFGTQIQSAGYENIGYSLELHGKITTGDFTNTILVGASRSLRALAGSPATPRTVPKVITNFNNPVIIANPNATIGTRPPITTVDDKGLYAFDQLNFRDVIILSGGVRATDYTNDGSTNTVTKTPYEVKPFAFSGGGMIKPMKWASIYGTYIQGLEENSIASNNVDNANTVFAPISSTLYEGGVKLEPAKNLLFQASYFDIKRVGAYNERNLPGTTILHGFADATQTYRGFEGSVSGYVLKDLAINAAITFLKARTNVNPALAPTRPGGTPNTTETLSGEYTVSWLDPNLKLSAGVYHTGSQAVDDTNNVFTPSYTTFDVGAAYDFTLSGHDVTARVNGQNITNERYWAAVGGGSLSESLPAVVKFSLSFKY
jgi:iron complex outermembrane receptor protein